MNTNFDINEFLNPALEYRIAKAYKQLMDNLTDTGTGNGTRKLILEFIFVPNTERTKVAYTADCKVKLAPSLTFVEPLYIGRDSASDSFYLRRWQRMPGQSSMLEEDEDAINEMDL